MQKKVLAMVLFLCMIAGTLIPTAYAVGGDTWTEHVTKMPSGYVEDTNGNVTISSADGLAWFAKQVNEEGNTFAGKTITLVQSIDLSGYEWVPIGTQAHLFCGTFDGETRQFLVCLLRYRIQIRLLDYLVEFQTQPFKMLF